MYFVMDDWRQWGPDLGTWLDERFDAEVLRQFNATVEPNWLDWLDQRQAEVDGCFQDSVGLFEQVIRGRYAGITVIHATRLTSLDAVREHGLRAWSERELIEQAVDKFRDSVEAKTLRLAIERCDPLHRSGRVYSFASLHHALGLPGEYLAGRIPSFAASGGEFLAAVAVEAGKQVVQELAPPGRGYFLACNLPWAWLESEQVIVLAKDILQMVLTIRFFDTDDYSMVGNRECIDTMRDIPPENIELFADVEELRDREDLTSTDIRWLPFERQPSL